MAEVDEFGIEIKAAPAEVDEFGIPLKKKFTGNQESPATTGNASKTVSAPSVENGERADLTPITLTEESLQQGQTPTDVLQPIQEKPDVETYVDKIKKLRTKQIESKIANDQTTHDAVKKEADELANEYAQSKGYNGTELGYFDTFLHSAASTIENMDFGLKYMHSSPEVQSKMLKEKYDRQQAMGLEPKGHDFDLFKPSTWSLSGATGSALELAGGIAPFVASGVATGGAGALPALVAGAATFGLSEIGAKAEAGYTRAKQQGLSDEEAASIGHTDAAFGAATGTVAGGALHGMGSKELPKSFTDWMVKTGKKNSAIGTIFATMQLGHNAIDNAQGLDVPMEEGVAKSFVTGFGIGAVMDGIHKLGGSIGAKEKDKMLNAVAYTNPDAAISGINKAAESGAITKAEAAELTTPIVEKSKAFSVMPDNLSFEMQEKMLPLVQEIQVLEKKKETSDAAFHSAIDAEIEVKRKQIAEETGAALTEKEQKEYERLIEKRDATDGEGNKKPLLQSEKDKVKHYEKRIKQAGKNEANTTATELGYDHAKHLLNDLKAKGLGEFENVQDVPKDVLEQLKTPADGTDTTPSKRGNEIEQGGKVEALDGTTPDNTKAETVEQTEPVAEAKNPVESVTQEEAVKFLDDHGVQGKIGVYVARPDFRLSSEELSRGMKQIREGQTDKVAAKKVLEKIKEWRDQDYVDFIFLKGGSTTKLQVPFDVAKAMKEMPQEQVESVASLSEKIEAPEVDFDAFVEKNYTNEDGTLNTNKLAQELAESESGNYWGKLLELSEQDLLNLQSLLKNEEGSATTQGTNSESTNKIVAESEAAGAAESTTAKEVGEYQALTEKITMPDGEAGMKVTIVKPNGERVDLGKMYPEDVEAEVAKKVRGFKLAQTKNKTEDTRTPIEKKIDGINGEHEQARNNPIGKEVLFEHAGAEKKGVVKSIDPETGEYQITGTGNNRGINYRVKPENAVIESAEVSELRSKNESLLNEIKNTLSQKKQEPAKKEADKIVKMGVPASQQLADLPNQLFQNVLADKVVRPLEDYVAKTIQKASVSTNKAARNIADFVTSFSRGIVDTREYSKNKRHLTGDINSAKLEAQDMHKSMWDLIGGDINAADRVHQVLDPELRQTGLAYADLTANEQQLFNLLRKINDYTHNENFLIDRISQETFDKFKDKYIGREYDYEMSYDPQIGKPLKEILGIYRQRGEVDIDKQLHSIKDPIYLTLRRFLQTGQNKAIVEYADILNNQYKTGNTSGNEPLVLTKSEAKGRDGFVELGKGHGKLSNKFVARHIAEDFKGFFFNNSFMQIAYDLNRVYDGLAPRQWMKELLTVGNPQVQLGNFTSNVIFSWMGGVDAPTYLSKLPEAIRQINDKGDVYRSLTKEGLLSTDFVSSDLKPMQSKLGAPQNKNVVVKGREKLRDLYGGADDAAKIQMYLSLKDMGYTHEQSVTTIFEALQNYQNTGRIWDFASKTPIVGNAFVKFTPEMLRMLKNGATRRPLHTMALIGMLYSMPKLIGKYFGNEDEEIEAAGRQKGIPKIMIPYTDLSIPLSWRFGDKRVNIARYMMPMYQYDIGGEDKIATEFANKFIPYKIKTTEEGGLEPSVDDPFVAPIISVIRNKDFRDKQITEETDNSFDKTLKRVRYIGRGYGGWYANMADDIFSTAMTGEDFYGRRKTATDIALNTLIKIETFDDARLKEGIQREFDGYERASNKLYQEYTKKRKALQSDLEQVEADKKMTPDRKKIIAGRTQKKLQHLAENVLDDVAEIQDSQLKATEFYRNLSRKQPYKDLEKYFKDNTEEISKIEKRIDGKFKEAKPSPFSRLKGFKGFKKVGN